MTPAPKYITEANRASICIGQIALCSGRSRERAAVLYRRICEIAKRTRYRPDELVNEWMARAYAREFSAPSEEQLRRAVAKVKAGSGL